MYQAEAAPPAVRGAIVSFYQLAITIGILVSQGVDLGTEKIHSTASWYVCRSFCASTSSPPKLTFM
jgi:SP family sugar:H+ symporter-like MFS transporter